MSVENDALPVGSADDVDDVQLEPEPAKEPLTDFQQALVVFVDRVDEDPAQAREYISSRIGPVRLRAQTALAMDSSPREKLLAWIDATWYTALSGVVGSTKVVPTERDRMRRLAAQVAFYLDEAAMHLASPIDVSAARRSLIDAEACF